MSSLTKILLGLAFGSILGVAGLLFFVEIGVDGLLISMGYRFLECRVCKLRSPMPFAKEDQEPKDCPRCGCKKCWEIVHAD